MNGNKQNNHIYKDNSFYSNCQLLVVECNLNMIPTTEGLYLNLLENSTILGLFRNSSTNTNEVKSIMIADFDHKTFTLLNMIEDPSDSLNKKLCIILATSIDTHKRRLDEYFMINDEFLNNIIIYNNFGALMIPTCSKVESVELITNNDICYENLKIKFNLNGTNFFGYLTQDGVIRHKSKIIPCSIT